MGSLIDEYREVIDVAVKGGNGVLSLWDPATGFASSRMITLLGDGVE